ncbi:hypothetical protein ABZP36_010102 [Zizania latifolia]
MPPPPPPPPISGLFCSLVYRREGHRQEMGNTNLRELQPQPCHLGWADSAEPLRGEWATRPSGLATRECAWRRC